MSRRFQFYNPNPQGKETGDCVIRALCKATDREWMSVYDELCNFGRDFGVLPNSDEAYEEFLEHNGFSYFKIARPKKGQTSTTVLKFCEKNNKGTFVLRCAHHLVCVKDGKYYDLNIGSGNGKVYRAWEVTDDN